MDFVVGHESDQFGVRLAHKLGCEYKNFRNTYMRDGEPRPKIFADYDAIKGNDVLVVYRGKQLPDRLRIPRGSALKRRRGHIAGPRPSVGERPDRPGIDGRSQRRPASGSGA